MERGPLCTAADLSTSLSEAGTEESKRQAIAGHSSGTILNIHYTSHDMAELKRIIDRVDFKIAIEHSDRHGFPIIVGCDLVSGEAVEVTLHLSHDGWAEAIILRGENDENPDLDIRIGKRESLTFLAEDSTTRLADADAADKLVAALGSRPIDFSLLA